MYPITKPTIEFELTGNINTYCEQIQTGCKLVAEIGFHKKYLSNIKKEIKQNNCKVVFKKRPYDRYVAFIYKYNFVKYLITELFMNAGHGKISIFKMWAMGKIFGYSDFEIAKYMEECGRFKSTFM